MTNTAATRRFTSSSLARAELREDPRNALLDRPHRPPCSDRRVPGPPPGSGRALSAILLRSLAGVGLRCLDVHKGGQVLDTIHAWARTTCNSRGQLPGSAVNGQVPLCRTVSPCLPARLSARRSPPPTGFHSRMPALRVRCKGTRVSIVHVSVPGNDPPRPVSANPSPSNRRG
jgi:hypothetical protein